MHKHVTIAALLAGAATIAMPAAAKEGMYTPDQLPEIAADLRETGLEISPEALSDLTGFPMGAIVSLVHDVLITMGVFAVFQIKFDLTTIAALLTIVGYSINDTVVVFDRLRENLMKYKKRPLRDLMNLSVNETLSRTVMTSGTTLVALIALLVLGGDVIRGFVFAITFGIIIGTYSSIYVAKNVVLWLGVKRDWSKKDPKQDGSPFSGAEAP